MPPRHLTSRRFARHLRRAALGLSVGVMWLHATILVVFWAAELRAPLRLTGIERAWVHQHQRIAQVLVAGLLAATALTFAAAAIRGGHRWLLVLSWTAFVALAAMNYYREMAAMIRVSWWWLT